jgi:hypothetical protein
VTIRKIHVLSSLLIVLIFIDLVATIYWISAGVATEANPIMDYYLKHSIVAFAVAKLSISFFSLSILLKFKKRFKHFIFRTLFLLTLIYAAVFGWHITGLLFLVFQTN